MAKISSLLHNATTQQRPRALLQKAASQNLGDAENDVPVRHGLDDMAAQPLSEFHHALLMARGTRSRGQRLLQATEIT
jgi:hypothetical protein